MSRDRAPRVFLGRLPRDIKERDVEKFFRGFGRIREINLKNGFGFVVRTDGSVIIYKLRSSYKHTITCPRTSIVPVINECGVCRNNLP